MLLLILESLGSTELLFILIMALVFFGPRKLPQLSRSLGRSLAEFRRASEDFKRTWEREVAMENPASEALPDISASRESSALTDQQLDEPSNDNQIAALPNELAVPRQRKSAFESDNASAEQTKIATGVNASEPLPKRDWL